MTVEERLRRSIEAYAESIVVAPDVVDDIRARATGRRPRRRTGLVLVAIAAVVVLVLAVGLGRSNGGGDRSIRVRPAATPSAAMPGEIVVAQGTKLVAVSAGDGRVLRTIADAGRVITSLAVSPDAATVYFSSVSADCRGDIARIPSTGGAPTVIGHGSLLQLSPDGRALAYSFSASNDCAGGIRTAVIDLVRGTADHLLMDPVVHDPQSLGSGSVVPLSWAADSRHLLYSVGTGEGDQTSVRYAVWDERFITSGHEPGAEEYQDVAVPSATSPLRYFGTPGHVVALNDVDGPGSNVSLIDLASGAGESLFVFGHSIVPDSLAVDASGTHLLFTTYGPAGPNAEGPTRLWRWSLGDSAPTELADSSGPADWLAR